jgi:hypothetical protein
MSDAAHEGHAPCTTREAVLVTLAILALIGLQLVLVNGLYLFSRRFWVDELYTHAVVADPNLGHAFAAIHGGMDSMPTYALILRGLSTFVAGSSEVFFRATSLLSIVLAMSGAYVLLRRRVAPIAALASVFVIWAHPLSLIHAFDARFHGPFLAAAVWFCFWVDRRLSAPDRRGVAIGLSAASLALCAIHVFGVIVWAIVLFAAALISRQWRPLLPASIGPLIVPVLWVLALQPQRTTITIPTWEGTFSWARVADTAGYVLLPEYLAAVFLLMWAVVAVRRVFTSQSVQAGSGPPALASLLLTSLCLLIPALVVVSLIIQPTLTARYSIPAIAALAPAVAYGLARIPRWGSALVLAALVLVSGNGLRRQAHQARWLDEQTDAMIGALRALPADRPVVFEVSHQLHVIWHYAPDLRSRVVLLDFENGQLPHPSPIRVVSRDLARAYGRFYDGPRRISWDEIQSSAGFYLVPDGRAYDRPVGPETRYPGFTVARLGPAISLATRK